MFEIVNEVIDERAVVQSVEDPRAGGICTFAGVVRDNSRGKRVLYLEYEAYAEMAVKQMQQIAAEMKARWDVLHVSMVHRTGRLEIDVPESLAGRRRPRPDVRWADEILHA